MRQINCDNGNFIVKPIFTEPTNKNPLINPNTELPFASSDNYKEHPYRGLVIFAPSYIYNGGFRFETDIKEGDIVLLPGEFVEGGPGRIPTVVMDGIDYPVVKSSFIIGHYTPTDEERAALKFKKEMIQIQRKNTLAN